MTDKVIFITATGNWQVPQDWNNLANKIECLGPGGNGGDPPGGGGAASGGGGAYAVKSNIPLTPFAQIPAVVATGGSQTDTDFNSSQVVAKAGQNAANGAKGLGGKAASCTPTTGAHSGGDGVDGVAVGGHITLTGPGGGGAAGPAADGVIGNVGTSSNNTSQAGGAGGNSGSGALGGAASNTKNNGAAGTGTWVSNPGAVSIGPGAGGSGGGVSATTPSTGGDGGLYGGAGGGGANENGTLGAHGAGQPGIIIITYTPATTPVAEMMWKPTPENLKGRGRAPRKRNFSHGRWYHTPRSISYFLYTPSPYVIGGPGETDIRQKEPELQKLRSTLTKLRIISPKLEE